MSYQTEDEDVLNSLITMREHLELDGIAVADFWFGPAVLTQKPEVRFKQVSDEKIEVSRVAVPVLHCEKNIVDVNYYAFMKNKETEIITEINECHRMRYFFVNEINYFAEQADMELVKLNAWLSHESPNIDTWAAVVVLKKK